MCIFESDTVKSDCSMQENYDIFKVFNTDCWFTLLVLLIKKNTLKMKKKALKMNVFRAFFLFLLSPDPKYEKKIL